jgi:hypothetical protein
MKSRFYIVLCLFVCLVGCDKNKDYYRTNGTESIDCVKLNFVLLNTNDLQNYFSSYSVSIGTTKPVTVQMGTSHYGQIIKFGELIEPSHDKKTTLELHHGRGWIKLYDENGKFFKFHSFNWRQ